MKEILKVMKQSTKIYLGLGIVLVICVFMLGRVSKPTEVIIAPNNNTYVDSLEYELKSLQEEKVHLDSVLTWMGFTVDSLISNHKVVTKRYRINQKKQYENTQKMSLDSAVVARNILLDSAINAQSRIRTSKSDSSN